VAKSLSVPLTASVLLSSSLIAHVWLRSSVYKNALIEPAIYFHPFISIKLPQVYKIVIADVNADIFADMIADMIADIVYISALHQLHGNYIVL
jgi:hypothetical protein